MEGSRLQIASLRRIKGVGEYPGIGGRIKSEWVGALNRKRWAHHPGIRILIRELQGMRRLRPIDLVSSVNF